MEVKSLRSIEYKELRRVAFTYPAIDNHAHALLRAEHRDDLAFEGLISEAKGDALTTDAVQTLACYRATRQLADLFRLPANASWKDVKAKRLELEYVDLCKLSFQATGIQCILIDDGLNPRTKVHDISWHDQFVSCPSRRIVRIELVAEEILEKLFGSLTEYKIGYLTPFTELLAQALIAHASNSQVVGFKSIVCYRTGLAVAPRKPSSSDTDLLLSLADLLDEYKAKGTVRICQKALNDYVLHIALEIAGQYNKPVQFHTGLGDSDINLPVSSPAHLQPLIRAYPKTTLVILHSSYPYTRDAGYLTSVYANVFLDFGEVFPLVSGQGQRSIIRQILELTPTNKIMWSTDAHFWPESYHLGAVQARSALHEVLRENVHALELTEAQAIMTLKNALFHNANRVYKLGLEPNFSELQ